MNAQIQKTELEKVLKEFKINNLLFSVHLQVSKDTGQSNFVRTLKQKKCKLNNTCKAVAGC